MRKLLSFLLLIPNRLYWKVVGVVYRFRGCDFSDFRDPSFGLDVGYRYSSSRLSAFRELMRKVISDFLPREQIAFFDVGFGKGNVLIEAMRFGIVMVGGIELSETMVTICRKNMEILGWKGAKLYNENAAEINEPLDDFNLFYMFNPFPESVMKLFLQNLIASKKRKPRKIFVVYFHATLHRVVEDAGFQTIFNHQQKTLFDPNATVHSKIYSL
jgi:16S rRNA G966 N2-methylase RsmD